MTDPIPTVALWASNPLLAQSQDAALIAQSESDAQITSGTIALGVAATVIQAAIPIVSAAISATPAGPLGGALATAGLTALSASMTSQHTAALAGLTATQQSAITTAVAIGASVAIAKLTPGTTP